MPGDWWAGGARAPFAHLRCPLFETQVNDIYLEILLYLQIKFARAIEFCFTSSEHSYIIGLHCFIDLPWRCHNKDTPIRPGPNRSNKVFRRDSDFQNSTSLQIHRVFFGSVVRWARWCKGAVCAPKVPPLRDSGKRYISRGSTIPANKFCPCYLILFH